MVGLLVCDQRTVAIQAVLLQHIRMPENAGWRRHGSYHLGNLGEILFLVAHAASLDADFLGLDIITVALFADLVVRAAQLAVLDLAMAVIALYLVVGHVRDVTEQQRVLILLLAARKDQERYTGDTDK